MCVCVFSFLLPLGWTLFEDHTGSILSSIAEAVERVIANANLNSCDNTHYNYKITVVSPLSKDELQGISLTSYQKGGRSAKMDIF